jgi:hypothetical protein
VLSSVEAIVHEIKMTAPPPIAAERLIAALSDMVYRFLYR